jgi:alkyl hydroperoxide reductase subunit AhpF
MPAVMAAGNAGLAVFAPLMRLDAKIEKWDRHRFETKLVNPANKRKYSIIVVGTGLAGASASASAGGARLQR